MTLKEFAERLNGTEYNGYPRGYWNRERKRICDCDGDFR